jgi:hypothetical protein
LTAAIGPPYGERRHDVTRDLTPIGCHHETEEVAMPSTRKEAAPVVVDAPEITGRYVDLGGNTVAFEPFHVDVDPAPLFRGLPDDRCQCPHWGVVVAGRITMRFADHDETYTAGDAYYIPPGHLPLVIAGSEVVEFSPTELLQQTMRVVGANMAANV